MALALKPKLLLLDEPTGGMSPEERRVTGELLEPIKAHCALLIVEHDLDFIRDICDQLTVLDQGKVLDRATSRRSSARAKVQQVYHDPCLTRPSSRSTACAPATAAARRCSTCRSRRRRGARSPCSAATAPARSTLLKTLFGELPPMSGTIRLDGTAVDARADRAAGAARHRLRAAGARHLRQAHGAREPAAGLRAPARSLGHRRGARLLSQAGAAAGADGRHAVGRRAQDAGDRPRPAGPAEAPDARRADRGRLGRRDRGDRRRG